MKKTTIQKDGISCALWTPEAQGSHPLLVVLPEQADTNQIALEKVSPFLEENFQKERPCSVLLPEAAKDWGLWEDARPLQQLLYQLEYEEPVVDGCRMYLLGGSAAWTMGSRFPRRFAAVVPLSGWADPYQARNLKFVPVWAFHAADDSVVPVSGVQIGEKLLTGSHRTVMALRTCGSACVKYTELPAGGAPSPHELWNQVFCGPEKAELLAWLFQQDRKKQLEVTFVRPGLWRIDDYFTSTCYLVTGAEKALLVDTGMGEGDLTGLVRSLTSLPVEVAITHPHRDHIALAEQFDKVYLHEKDVELLDFYQAQMKGFFGNDGPSMPPAEKLVPIREGSRIDLGGGVVIETAELGGHTENSVVFIDDFHQAVFTGDAIGSGYLVLMICAVAQWKEVVSNFRKNLLKFQSRLPHLEGYGWYGGHFIQENGCNVSQQDFYVSGHSEYFCPISREIAEDMVGLCDRLLDGTIAEKDFVDSPEHFCSWRTAGMSFRFLNRI